MYTNEGRFFSGSKTYWHVTVSPAGVVVEILASVKAWDNEGHSFQGPVRPLTSSERAQAMQDTQAHQDVIEVMVRDLYETSMVALPPKEVKSVPEQKSVEPREDPAISGPGAVLADGQEVAGV